MTLVALGRLAHDLDRDTATRDQFLTNPEQLLAGYDLSIDELNAVLDLSAERLVALGLNPMVMWNIVGSVGIPWRELYTHSISLRKA